MKIRGLLGAATVLILATAHVPGAAQSYPDKPIRLLVPAAAGSNTDMLGRVFAASLEKTAGQRITVENRPGAGGDIGAGEAIRAAPDGYTVLLGSSSVMAANKWIYPRTFDSDRDLVPVVLVGAAAAIVLGAPQFKGKPLSEVLGAAKAAPNPWTVAAAATFTSVTYGLFRDAVGVDLTLVPYKANQAAFVDVMRGEVPLMVDAVPSAMALVQDGRLAALALASPQRSQLFPTLPTLRELGYDVSLAGWNAVVVPKGTPAAVIETLNRLGNQALQDPQLRERYLALGVDVGGGTPADLARLIDEDSRKYGHMIQKLKLQQ